MNDVDELVSAARAAYGRGDWHTTYDRLSRARERSALASDDLAALGDAAWWLGLMRETLSITESVYQRFLDEGKMSRAAMNALELGLLWSVRGELAIGSGWVSRARRILQEQPEGPEHGYLLYVDATIALETNDPQLAFAHSARLQELGRRFQTPALTSFGLVLAGLVEVKSGRTASGFALLDEAMLPILANQVPPEWAADIYCTIIHVCHQLGDLRRMREWTAATERWCERYTAAVVVLGICSVHRLQLLSTEGAWDQAQQELGAACAVLEGRNGWVAGEGFYQLGEISRLRGDYPAAQRHYDKARALGIEPQPGDALLKAACGDLDAAWAGLRSALEGCDHLARMRLLGAVVDVALSRGYVEEAEQACRELESTAGLYGSPGFLAWARHARGALLVHQSRESDALPVLHAALRAYTDLHAVHETAEVHELMSRAHQSLGQHDLADADAEAAVLIYRRLRAEPDIRRLSRIASCPGGLTRREMEVLAQIAAGASNREVGVSLFISEKTVARHLANIFTKIGVSSRTAAAAWAHRNGVTAAGSGT